jgi:hypothetical protein
MNVTCGFAPATPFSNGAQRCDGPLRLRSAAIAEPSSPLLPAYFYLAF